VAKPRKRAADNGAEAVPAASDLRIIGRLLGLLLVKGRGLEEQAGTLTSVGFQAAEIAPLLGTTTASVNQSAYMWRKSKAKRKKGTRGE
jgi:hypothetical protein